MTSRAILLVAVLLMEALAAQRDYPSRTAIANVFHRALGAKNPDPNFRNPDYLAAQLLGAPERALLVDHVRAAIDLDYQTAMQRLPPPSPALVTTHLLRTRHIDLALRNALSAETRQVVILGAGYDTRAYRFHDQLAGMPVFEVDRPATQKYKKLRVREALGEVYKSVRWVAATPGDDDLLTKLRSAGYSERLRTFFVWEGATYYLPESGIRNVLRFVSAHSAPGSTIAFDYMDESNPGINNPTDFHARVGEPLLFGFAKGGASAFVRSEGLEVVSDLSYDELYDRYGRRPDGSPAMPHSGGPATLAGICVARVPVTAE
ncbi:MAG TPA: SAM-dependent methyltransferase [Bryobacteraceae bacterium]|jgi:methyltransferase (TIGR00027 family)|nr:SAM-dependent methyltransferase [Bryobacteraceae bacterium]